MSHRGIYNRKGEFLIGAKYSADVAARAEVQRRQAPARGDFVVGAPIAAPIAKAARLPAVYEEFESSARVADELAVLDRKHEAATKAVEARLADVRRQLDSIKKARSK